MIISPVLWMAFMLIVIAIWQIYLIAFGDGTMRQLNRSAFMVLATGIGSLIGCLVINLTGGAP